MKCRRMRFAIPVALAAASLMLAGCGEGSTSSSTATSKGKSGLNLTADVDPATGRVVLPGDRYTLGTTEMFTLVDAQSGATAACARKLGIPWTGSKTANDPSYSMWNAFGPWTKPMAQKFAFTTPVSDRDQMEGGYVAKPEGYQEKSLPNSQLSDEQVRKVGSTCHKNPTVKKFDPNQFWANSPWAEDLDNTRTKTIRDPRAKKVFEELRTCYAGKGMTFDDESPGLVMGADTSKINEEQIGLAVKVAECQESVNVTQRLTKIMASIQKPTIEKYADELVAKRAKIDKTLAEAKNYIESHPELFESQK